MYSYRPVLTRMHAVFWAPTFLVVLLAVFLTVLFATGCQQQPPPPDPASLQEEVKQLDEHRQKEWGNK